jgi:hypothetical protein
MMQLSFAYLAAAGLISVLVLLGRKNRQQGWRRLRGVWLTRQAEAALRSLEAPAAAAPSPDLGDLGHLGDLGRLQESLVAHGAPVTPAPAEKPLKSNVLA